MTSKLLKNVWFLALIIGVTGGLCAITYYYLLNASLHLYWHSLFGHHWRALFQQRGFDFTILAITSLGGLLVGLSLKFMGEPGEIAAVIDNIHVRHGRLSMKETPAMIVNSLVSIGAGGSAGPEAPLVQIIGSLASRLGEKLKLEDAKIRLCTFCGMACALGAFFGAPIGGALFALEIPHRKSIEYGEAIVPTLISATVGFLIYRSVIGYDGPMFATGNMSNFSIKYFFYAFLLALLGTFFASLFIFIFKTVEKIAHPLKKYPLLMGTLGGFLLGLIALKVPQTLFWGEWQIVDLLHSGVGAFSSGQLIWIALAKMLAVAVTLHFGFRGGFIFPLFFIGAALGLVVSQLYPVIPVALATLSLMTALNVCVTKTPLATVVILISLSGSNLFPYLALVSIVSLVVTNKLGLIATQQSIPK